MKRDMDLVRAIMKQVADSDNPRGPETVSVHGYSDDQIAHHIKLMVEAGFLKAIDVSSFDGLGFIHPNLTWHGHEFLEAARNEKVWQKLKAELRDRGLTVPFSLVQSLLMKIVSRELGLGDAD